MQRSLSPALLFTLRRSALAAALLFAAAGAAQAQGIDAAALAALDQRIAAVGPKLVEWRRDIHANPELSGQEARTAKLVADHLRKLGLEVQTGVGGHGVVGVLKGALPGKTVALRADIDALPVAELTGLPFASKAKGIQMGKESAVMHACGHDGHTAILMGTAELLTGMKSQLAGTVKFIFQPAEEGYSEMPAANTSWGAKAMVEQGVLNQVDAAFGLHISPALPVGMVGYRSGPLLAGADTVRIKVTGKQTHGAFPWAGVDPIVASAQVVTGLQTIVSRQLNISNEPAVLTIGAINGGNRENIVPESVEMIGTLRTFDEEMRSEAKQRITTTAQNIAAASGAKAEVSFGPSAYPVTTNPAALTEASLPALRLATGGKVMLIPKISGSEDFSEFQKKVPGFFYILGALPAGKTPATAAPNHSPAFDFNEDALPVGVRTLSTLALDFLARK
ncbi:MAG TPA: amidohydrolase [Burkholderiaceae bacterium]|nr:amidohydrolase [Burkholderiaceae bacterium]